MSQPAFISDGTAQNFADLVIKKSAEVPVLVDFWASWCNPCQILMPIVSKLAEEYQGKFHLVKVNADEQQALVNQYGVRSLPTLKLFHDAQIVEEIMGVQPEPVLRQLLEQYIAVEQNPLVNQAHALAQQGQLQQARQLMAKAFEEDPQNQQIAIDLIRLTIMTGDLEAAETMLQEIPAEQRQSAGAKELRAILEFTKTTQESRTPEILEKHIADDPQDMQSRYQLAAWRALEGECEAALMQLLEIIKTQRNWKNGKGRAAMLAVFDLIPDETDLVGKYRRLMSNLLH